MKRVYGKPVRELIREYVEKLDSDQRAEAGEAGQDVRFTRQDLLNWFQDNYPKVKRGTINAHLSLMSTNSRSRIHHNPKADGSDDLLYQEDSSTFRRYDPSVDPAPIRAGSEPAAEYNEENEDESREFAYERDLKNYLSKNLQKLEQGLKLFEDDGVNGIEFPVGGRYIDILAVDGDENLVVIELKVSRGYDRVVGQLLRYMAWIEKNQAEEGQRIRGIIVAREISDDLKLATSRVTDIDLYEYELTLAFNRRD